MANDSTPGYKASDTFLRYPAKTSGRIDETLRDIPPEQVEDLWNDPQVIPADITELIGSILNRAPSAPSGVRIVRTCLHVMQVLIDKNVAYGDSAFDPVSILAKGVPKETLLRVRIDDKLSRLARGHDAGEDTLLDLMGYLVLLLAMQRQSSAP